MSSNTKTPLVCLCLVAAWAIGADPAEAIAQVGTIEGMVTTERPRPRRTADRYRQRGGAPRMVQEIPAVVYLLGSVPGSPPGSEVQASMLQRDTAFAPPAVAIQVGETVAFPNEDPFFHNVFSYSSSQRFDLGRYPQNESKSVTFSEVGSVSVFCEVHDFMRGEIVVTENAFHAVVNEDGSFRLEGVPAGEHRLAIWQPDHLLLELTVMVPAGGTARVEADLER